MATRNAQEWSVEQISDPVYRSKFVDLVRIISEWTADYFDIEGKDVLDFGCGEATTALGMALQKRPHKVVGVEIQDEFLRCLPLARNQIGLNYLPDNIIFERVTPGAMHNPDDRFDLIYSWSVFEHVEQGFIPQVLDSLRGMLKPQGLVFIQVAPLYYSAEGSHLKPWIPEPWAHLKYQHSVYQEMLGRGCTDTSERKTLRSVYRTLNKITANGLVSLARDAGFEVLRDYRTQDEVEPGTELLEIFQRDVVVTNQVVLLLRDMKG